MANTITLFKTYIDQIDDVYKLSSLTSRLDGAPALARQGANANEIVVPKLAMDGLGDYSRNSGYVAGSVTLTNETVQFNYERGRKFTVDTMDNEETMGVMFGTLMSEFIRTKVVPEVDAFRFAQYSGTTNISKVASAAALATGDAVIAALRVALNKMDEDEVPTEGRICYITPTLMGLVDDLDTTKSKAVMGRFSAVVQVPQSRFYTAIDLKDGTTEGETAGGFAKASAAHDINFMIIHPTALLQYPKHVVEKIIAPEVNQTADGWLFFYRSYGLADVYENKVAGIYLHDKNS